MNVSIRVTDQALGLEIRPERIRWSGPTDPEVDAPFLAWELTAPDEQTFRAFADADPDALGALVARWPMPSTMLAALAAHCLDEAAEQVSRSLREEQALAIARGDVDADVRWARALAAHFIARGVAARSTFVAAPATIVAPRREGRMSHLRVMGDGMLVALEAGPAGSALHYLAGAQHRTVELPTETDRYYTLLAPTGLPGATVALATYVPGSNAMFLDLYDARGVRTSRAAGRADSWPESYTQTARSCWVHMHDSDVRVVLVDETEARPLEMEPRVRGAVRTSKPLLSNGWLLGFGGSEAVPSLGWIAKSLEWISLDGEPLRTFPWGMGVHSAVADPRDGDTLWCISPDGLWRLVGGEAPTRVWSGKAQGFAIEGGLGWVGLLAEDSLVAIDLTTGVERRRIGLPHRAYTVHLAPGGIFAAAGMQFSWVTRDGVVRATTEPRRDTGFALLADGTGAGSAGEQVVICSPDGQTHRCAPLHYDGKLLGATGDRFLFGPASGNQEWGTIDAVVAIDRAGRFTSQLKLDDQIGAHISLGHNFFDGLGTPTHGGGVDPNYVYVVDTRGAVCRWDPRGPDEESTMTVPVPPARHHTMRKARSHGPQTINPRDDYPEVGKSIRHSNFLAIESSFGGSTGVYEEVPIRVGDGAIATFVDCDLREGTGGSVVQRHSTLLLVRCKLPTQTWRLGHDCHLVAVDCQVAGTLQIELGAGASAVIENTPGLSVKP